MPRIPTLFIACLSVVACTKTDPPAGSTSSGVLAAPSSAVYGTSTAAASVPAPPTVSASAPSAASSTAVTAGPAPPVSSLDAGATSHDSVVPRDAGSLGVATKHVPNAAPSDAGATAASDAGGASSASPALAIARKIDAIFAAKTTFSATFQQRYTLKINRETKTSSGVVLMERPSKISFRYNPPSRNRIVSDGTTLRIYTADDNQLIETPAQNTQYPGALSFMMGNGIASSFDFSINTQVKTSPGVVVLDGKPFVPNPSYERALFFVDEALLDRSDPNAMRGVLVIDAQGNRNGFDFSAITQPSSISPGEFVFAPPAGATVVRK